MSESQNNKRELNRLGIDVSDTIEELQGINIVVRLKRDHLTKRAVVNLFAQNDTSDQSRPIIPDNIKLHAILCNEFALLDSKAPIPVRVKNGRDGTEMNGDVMYDNAYYSAVFPPSPYSTLERTLFDPPKPSMKSARESFPNLSLEGCEEGVRRIPGPRGKSATMALCVDYDAKKRAVCPLGALLFDVHEGGALEDDVTVPIKNGLLDSEGYSYYIVSVEYGEKLLKRFILDVMDPRPTMASSNLMLEAFGTETDQSGDFSLCLSLTVYFYRA